MRLTAGDDDVVFGVMFTGTGVQENAEIGMVLIRLAYVSRSSLPGNFRAHEAIADILASARRNNEAAGVIGALLVADAAFAQVLEGEQEAVEATYKRITCDRRHHDIVLLLEEPVSERQFPQWSMAHIGPSQSAEEAVARVSQTLPGTKCPRRLTGPTSGRRHRRR